MEFQIAEIGAATKVYLQGRLDAPSVDRMETSLLDRIVPAGRSTVVDLSGVTFISSLGIRMLINATQALREKHASLVLFGAQPPVAESLNLVIRQLIPLVETEPQALALLNG